MPRTTLKKAASNYRAQALQGSSDPCLSTCGYDIEMAFRAGWAASTANRWPKARIPKKRRGGSAPCCTNVTE